MAPVGLERLPDERKLEIRTIFFRHPITRRGAVRDEDAGKTCGCRGLRSGDRRECRNHRLQQGERYGRAGAPEKRPTGQVLLTDKH